MSPNVLECDIENTNCKVPYNEQRFTTQKSQCLRLEMAYKQRSRLFLTLSTLLFELGCHDWTLMMLCRLFRTAPDTSFSLLFFLYTKALDSRLISESYGKDCVSHRCVPYSMAFDMILIRNTHVKVALMPFFHPRFQYLDTRNALVASEDNSKRCPFRDASYSPIRMMLC